MSPRLRLLVQFEACFWGAVLATTWWFGFRGALATGVAAIGVFRVLRYAHALATAGPRSARRADAFVTRSVPQLDHSLARTTVTDIRDLAGRAGADDLRIAFVRVAESGGQTLMMSTGLTPPVLYVTDHVFAMEPSARRAAIAHELGHLHGSELVRDRILPIGLVELAVWLGFGAVLVAVPLLALLPKRVVLGTGFRLGLFLRDAVVEPRVDRSIARLGEDPGALAAYLRVVPGDGGHLGDRLLDQIRWHRFRHG